MFVNYDAANLAMYGNVNPLDGLKVLSKYVKAFHAKYGIYPTNPNRLVKELQSQWAKDHIFTPQKEPVEIDKKIRKWKKALEKAKDWIDDDDE